MHTRILERERKSCTTCSRVFTSCSRRRGSHRWRNSATVSATIAQTVSSSREVASRVSRKPSKSSTAAGVWPAERLACTQSETRGQRSIAELELLEPTAPRSEPEGEEDECSALGHWCLFKPLLIFVARARGDSQSHMPHFCMHKSIFERLRKYRHMSAVESRPFGAQHD